MIEELQYALQQFSLGDWLVCLPLLLICVWFWLPTQAEQSAVLLLLLLAYVVFACWHFRQRDLGFMLVAGFGAVATVGALYVRRR
jgi:cbb3-type cytochrome oxidase subunit 3